MGYEADVTRSSGTSFRFHMITYTVPVLAGVGRLTSGPCVGFARAVRLDPLAPPGYGHLRRRLHFARPRRPCAMVSVASSDFFSDPRVLADHPKRAKRTDYTVKGGGI